MLCWHGSPAIPSSFILPDNAYYNSPFAHPSIPPLLWYNPPMHPSLRNAVTQLADRHPTLDLVYLFGSRAGNSFGVTSGR